MEKTNSNSGNRSNGNSTTRLRGAKNETMSTGMQSSQLMKLFEDELKDIYWAEKALVKGLPKMIKKATSGELITALTNHLAQTEEQVRRVEQVFDVIEKKAVAKKCEAMEGLLKEAETIMGDTVQGAMRDAGIISAGQKIEHYEIATYGTLRQFAQTLGLNEAVGLLQMTLDEEKAADELLTQVAVSAVNIEASQEEDEEEEEE